MILGIASAVLFIFECVFPAINKLNVKKRKVLVRAHCIAGFALFAVSAAHLASTIPLWNSRPMIMSVLGCVMTAGIAAICIMSAAKKHNKRLHAAITALIGIILCVHTALGLLSFGNYKEHVSEIHIENVDVSAAADGVYEGECDVGYIYARVRVTVTGGRMTEIKILEHRNERGGAAEVITDNMLSEQRIDVDSVTEATSSCKVIKKAVENALNGKPQ